jgi:Trypsin-like peptidase domain
MKNLLFFFSTLMCISACSNAPSGTPVMKSIMISNTKATWVERPFSEWPQILLTNDYAFNKKQKGDGASAFLLDFNGDTMVCTAKHLLGDDMGISPEVPTSSFDKELKYWKIFARNNKLNKDTLNIKNISTVNIPGEKDILLMDLVSKKTSIQPLKPYMDVTPLKKGQKLQIIGCEYMDSDCHQKIYEAVYLTQQDGWLIVKPKTKFEAMGFSGAPVIDENGLVVGILSGSAKSTKGDELLTLQPIGVIAGF